MKERKNKRKKKRNWERKKKKKERKKERNWERNNEKKEKNSHTIKGNNTRRI